MESFRDALIHPWGRTLADHDVHELRGIQGQAAAARTGAEDRLKGLAPVILRLDLPKTLTSSPPTQLVDARIHSPETLSDLHRALHPLTGTPGEAPERPVSTHVRHCKSLFSNTFSVAKGI